MKKLFFTLLCLSSLSGLPGCREEETLGGRETVGMVKVPLSIGYAAVTRSSIGMDEDTDRKLSNLNVYAYREDGIIEASLYVDYNDKGGTQDPSLFVDCSMRYRFCAIANTGVINAPATLEELEESVYTISSLESLSAGLPMVFKSDLKASDDYASGVEILLEPKFARVDFLLDTNNLTYGDFKVESATVEGCNGRLELLSDSGCKAKETGDLFSGDFASAGDLQSLSTGNSISLYIPENRMGILLPGNTDPWKKVPGSVDEAGLCTYMEVCGTYSSDGIEMGGLTYRFYLGEDNCTSFNVVGGVSYTVTLSLSPEGAYLNDTWKVEQADGWNDSRSISLYPDSLTISRDTKQYFEVLISKGCHIRLMVDGEEAAAAGWEFSLEEDEDGKYRIKASATDDVETGVPFPVSVCTWDGQKRACAYVVAKEPDPIELQWTGSSAPKYIAQKGTLTVCNLTDTEVPTLSLDSTAVITEDKVIRLDHIANDTYTVSALYHGDRTLYLKTNKGRCARIDVSPSTLEIVAGFLIEKTYYIYPDGSSAILDYCYRGNGPKDILFKEDFDEELYSELLEMELEISDDWEKNFLEVDGIGFYVRCCRSEGMDIYSYYTDHPPVYTVTPRAENLKSEIFVSGELVLLRPFTGVYDSSTLIASLESWGLYGDNLPKTLPVCGVYADTMNVETIKAGDVYESGVSIEDGFSKEYITVHSDYDDLDFSINSYGKLCIAYADSPTSYSVGRVPLYAIVRNKWSGDETDPMDLGYINVFRNFDISATATEFPYEEGKLRVLLGFGELAGHPLLTPVVTALNDNERNKLIALNFKDYDYVAAVQSTRTFYAKGIGNFPSMREFEIRGIKDKTYYVTDPAEYKRFYTYIYMVSNYACTGNGTIEGYKEEVPVYFTIKKGGALDFQVTTATINSETIYVMHYLGYNPNPNNDTFGYLNIFRHQDLFPESNGWAE